MNARSFVWSIIFGVGLVALYVGERLIGAGSLRTMISGAAALAIVATLAVRGLRMARARGERARVERSLFLLALISVVALGLYVAQSDLWANVAGAVLEKSSPKLAGALAALWPAVLALGVIPTFLVELAYAAMHKAPEVESGRVRDALLSGVGIACTLIFSFSIYYVASERDAKWDFSYFRTARPGEATRNIVKGLDQPVTVSAFFPPANEVREQVAEYLSDLEKDGAPLKVEFYDHALEPKKARELGVTGNGTLVLAKGERKELLGIGLELEKARGQLRNFDQEFQKRLLTIAKSRRTIYFTTGHGERTSDKTTSTDQRWTIRALREAYGKQNYDVRNLGVAEGLASEIPQDAAAVVIAGPTEAFLPEELSALQRYLDRGGRVMLAVDPESPRADFASLLSTYGLKFDGTLLANDQVYLARTRQLSDRINIGTASYSSHPSVTSLGRLGQRAPLLLVGAGSLQTVSKPQGVRVDFTVHSHPQTWADHDGNFQLDPATEKRQVFELAAAVSKGTGKDETRMLVFADSDLLTDPVIENAGNAYLALDGMKWLLGEESIAGTVSTEEDAPIEHTRKQDVAWFYSTVFAGPAAVLFAGFWFTRRGGGRRRKGDSSEPEAKS